MRGNCEEPHVGAETKTPNQTFSRTGEVTDSREMRETAKDNQVDNWNKNTKSNINLLVKIVLDR
jgi:hypothetical protein